MNNLGEGEGEMELPKAGTRTARSRRLAVELTELRVRRGLSRKDVRQRTGLAPSTLYRIEVGNSVPQPRTLDDLLRLYGANDVEQIRIRELAQSAGMRAGWLHAYDEVIPPLYAEYISFENDAIALANYESLFVPGLLQTEDYARAAITGVLTAATSDEIERRVEVRMQRQAVLGGDNPVRLEAVIDEAALRRVVGSPAVMAAQLRALREPRPNVDLRVIPYGAGAHPGMVGSFVVMQFAGDVDDLVYLDTMAGDLFREAAADLERYGAMFRHLQGMALGTAKTVAFVEAVQREYEKGRSRK